MAITVLDQVIGVALGAALFSIASGLPFAIDAITFIIGAALLVSVRRPLQGERTHTTAVRTDIAEGMRFLFRHRLLRSMMASVAVSNLAGNISFGVLVVLVVDELDASEPTFGLVLGFGALGGVLGSILASRLAKKLGRRHVLATFPLLLSATYVINAVATSAWMVSTSFFIPSFAAVCLNVPGQSIRQLVTPEHLLGRVIASYRMFGMGAAPIGAIFGGVIAQATSVRTTNAVAAVVQTASWTLMVLALRHLNDSE